MAPFGSPQFIAAAIIDALAATAVFFHAERNRIRRPFTWACSVFLFLIVGLPLYAIHVRRVRRARRL